MFNGCSSLIYGPELPNITTAPGKGVYNGMFANCISLVESPVIHSTSMNDNGGAFNNMFKNCSKLQNIKVNFENWGINETINWVLGVREDGNETFIKPVELGGNRGYNYIPTDWNIDEIEK